MGRFLGALGNRRFWHTFARWGCSQPKLLDSHGCWVIVRGAQFPLPYSGPGEVREPDSWEPRLFPAAVRKRPDRDRPVPPEVADHGTVRWWRQCYRREHSAGRQLESAWNSYKHRRLRRSSRRKETEPYWLAFPTSEKGACPCFSNVLLRLCAFVIFIVITATSSPFFPPECW